MKKIMITCCICLFFGCKNDEPSPIEEGPSYEKLILGTWSFDNVTKTYYLGSTNKVDYIDTFPTSDGDYLLFSTDQKAIGILGGTVDTTTYSINNAMKTVNLGGEVYDLTTLNSTTLVFEEKERIDTPYTDYTLKFHKN